MGANFLLKPEKMEYKTQSMTVIVRSDDIIELVTNEGWNKPDTIEIATENAYILKQAVDGKARGVLSHIPNRYISKEILACYIDAGIGGAGTALMVTSFASKVVGNLFLKLTKKINKKETNKRAPVEIFTKKEAAEKWLLLKIAEHK